MAFNVRNTNQKSLTEILKLESQPFGVTKVQNVKINLKDGNYLHARIWFPNHAINDKSNSFATLIEYIPYRTDVTIIRDSIRHPFYAANGFVSMRIDMRGSCNSSGVLKDEYLKIEQDDALEAFDWIINQSWSNGNIGMFGKSWGGFNGLQIAARQHPALKTIITLMSTDDRYSDDVHYRGGCLLASDMLWWGSTMIAYQPRPQDPRIVGESWKKNWFERLNEKPMVIEWMKHQTRDDYWKHGSICEDWSKLKIPILSIGGFRDGYTNPVFRMADNLPNPNSSCIVGPWVHEYPEMAEPAPKIDYQQLSVKWFKKWLYPNIDNDLNLPRLSVYIQYPSSIKDSYIFREGNWHSTNKPKDKLFKNLYLNGNNLSLDENENLIDNFEIKFSGTLSHGMFRGTYCPFGFKGDFPGDQKNEDSKCLCFDSDIFKDDYKLMGLPSINLKLSSNEELANISVRLVDLYPNDGEHVLISWGQLNLTHKDSHEFPKKLEINKIFEATIGLDAVGIKIAKGHKLRIALSTCDWPQSWPSVETPILTLYSGELKLPIINKDFEVSPPLFGKPTIIEQDIELNKKRNYDRTKHIDYDYQNDKWTLTDIQDGGCTEINNNGDSSGFYFGEYNKNVWEITPNDPLSAKNKCDWIYEMGRESDDWHLRFESETTLTSDEKDFHLITTRKVYENKELISDCIYDNKIPRNFI